MSTVSGGEPVRGSAYYAAVGRPTTMEAAQATVQTARVFNSQLGELVHLRSRAVSQGEVVVQDRIILEFAPEGRLLVARSGETEFDSKSPQPSPHEVAVELRKQREEAPRQQPAAAGSEAPRATPGPASEPEAAAPAARPEAPPATETDLSPPNDRPAALDVRV